MTGSAGGSARWLRHLGWASTQAWAGAVVNLAMLVALSRFISPEEFGAFAAAMAVTGLATVIAPLGLGPAIVRETGDPSAAARTAFTIGLVTGTGVAIFLVVLAPWLSAVLLGSRGLDTFVIALSVTALTQPIRTISSGLLQRRHRFDLLAKIEIGTLALNFGVALCGALLGLGAWALVLGQIAGSIVAALLAFAVASTRPGFVVDQARSLLGFSRNFVWLQLIEAATRTVDRMVVSSTAGLAAVGLYQRGMSIRTIGSTLTLAPMDMISYPRLSEALGSPDRLGREFQYAQTLALLFSIPLTIAIFLAAPSWTAIVFGNDWAEAAPLIQAIVLTLPLGALDRATAVLARATNRQGHRVLINLATLGLVVLCLYLFAAQSLTLAAGVLAGIYALRALVTQWVAAHILGSSVRRILQSAAVPLGFGAAMILLGLGIEAALSVSLPSWLAEAIAAALSALAFAAVALASPGRLFTVEVAGHILHLRRATVARMRPAAGGSP